MKRHTFDVVMSAVGLLLAVLLLIAGALLTWAHTFVHNEVRTELTSQQIYFPAKDNPGIQAPEFAPMKQYAGQLLSTGAQAHTYANYYIANHLKTIGGGKTYAQLSTQAQANPSDTKLASTVETMFKGETLRGLLLNAYAFDTVGYIAWIASIAAWVGAGIMLVLAGFGFWHARRVGPDTDFLTGSKTTPMVPAAV